MRLVYLRVLSEINSSKLAFIDTDINFLGGHYFYWSKKDKDILYRKNTEYFQNLYGQEINLTAITGANGTGKSTLLHFIRYLIEGRRGNTERNPWFDSWSWVCLFEESGIIKEYRQRHAQGMRGNFVERPLFPKGRSYDNFDLSLKSFTKGAQHIFYSPHLDFNSFHKDFYPTDVSADAIFDRAIRFSNENSISARQSLKTFDIRRQLNFVEFLKKESDLGKDLDFLSGMVNPKLLIYPIAQSTSAQYSYPLPDDFTQIDAVAKHLESLLDSNGALKKEFSGLPTSSFRVTFELSLLKVIQSWYKATKTRGARKSNHVSFEKTFDTENFEPHEIGEEFFNSLKFSNENKKRSFIEPLYEIYWAINEGRIDFTGPNQPIAGSVSTDTGLFLLDKEEKILSVLPGNRNTELFYYDWDNFSTGEKAYLNLFSRLYHAKQYLSGISDKVVKVFLIDEPSTSFHPQWQKEYLDKLLRFIDSVFKGSKEVILTTHSPYVISDVQREDIIPLQPTIRNSNLFSSNTFGANIHELLANSFFLQNGYMGDVARGKIDSLINYLKKDVDEQDSFWDELKAKKFIDIIGEPLLKRDLQDLYYSRKSVDEIDQEIARLQKLREKGKGLQG